MAAKIEPMLRRFKDARTLPGDGRAVDFLSASFVENLIVQWTLPLPESNPAILEMFHDRNREPIRQLLPWSGEFAGKYLTASVELWTLTRDERLRVHIAAFLEALYALQDADGYLGPWPDAHKLTGTGPKCHYHYRDGEDPAKEKLGTWDAWGHYHLMLGMIKWHAGSGDEAALACARRIADLFCRLFLDTGKRLVSIGSEEMNLAPIHAFALLYEIGGEETYLRMAREIEKDFEDPKAGDYVRLALAGKEFFEGPKPRWESLHPVEGIAELHHATGEARYREAATRIWESIAKTDRHNTGGFSSGEGACGNPYAQGAIETCCTVAWMAFTADMLRMTGESRYADELEWSTLNGGLGSISPSGRWSTYNTAMDGLRWPGARDVGFQFRPGSAELSCCSVNAPRVAGLLADWAVMAFEGGAALNWYGPAAHEVRTPRGNPFRIEVEGDYPRSNKVRVRVYPFRPERFTMKFRIPSWSRATKAAICTAPEPPPKAGEYWTVDRVWSHGETVDLEFDFTPRLWVGERECEGKCSVYRGPILLAWDATLDPGRPGDAPPELDAAKLEGRLVGSGRPWGPAMLLEVEAADGRPARLCDFRSAGMSGGRYWSWLRVRGAEALASRSASASSRG